MDQVIASSREGWARGRTRVPGRGRHQAQIWRKALDLVLPKEPENRAIGTIRRDYKLAAPGAGRTILCLATVAGGKPPAQRTFATRPEERGWRTRRLGAAGNAEKGTKKRKNTKWTKGGHERHDEGDGRALRAAQAWATSPLEGSSGKMMSRCRGYSVAKRAMTATAGRAG